MQPALKYSWIALTAAAPAILLLTCWTLAVFHCRRRHWTTMDVFLVAILSLSIVQQFLGFIYSTLVLLKLSSPLTGEAVCTGLMWFFIFVVIFKGTTITSLAVDRWLFYTKYSYRLSIRKNHVRYHISVLAILSCMLGFTGLITFDNPELLTTSSSPQIQAFDQCTFLPFKFDLKFVIFYLSVHCIVILVGAIVLCKSSCHKNNNSNANNTSHLLPHTKNLHYKRRRRDSPSVDVTPTVSNTSTASSSISNSSPTAFFSTPGLTAKAVLSNSPNNAFHHPQNPMRLDFHDRCKIDEGNYRLSPALGILILTILFTHLPFMAATILSRLEILVPITSDLDQLTPFNWPVTNLVLWFQVIEGLCTLLVLLIVDNIVPTWIFSRGNKKEGSIKSPHSYVIESQREPKQETSFNPTSAVAANLNNRISNSSNNGNAGYTNRAFTPDFHTPSQDNNKFPITNGSLFVGLPTASSSSIRPPIIPQQIQTRNPQNFDGRFMRPSGYRQSGRNDLDTIGGQVFQEDESEYDRKSYHQRYSSMASCTTMANDDFEFSRPEIFQQRPLPTPSKEFGTYVVPKTLPPSRQQPFNRKKSTDSNSKKSHHQPVYEEFEITRQSSSSSVVPLRILNQPTSLSMNDLDLIDDTPSTSGTEIIGTIGEPYEHKQRMYRKRTRMQPSQHHPTKPDRRIFQMRPNEQLGDHRRVLSMECLSPAKKQTDHRNFLDISYLDTGEILVRKADSSKCVFVTDFL